MLDTALMQEERVVIHDVDEVRAGRGSGCACELLGVGGVPEGYLIHAYTLAYHLLCDAGAFEWGAAGG